MNIDKDKGLDRLANSAELLRQAELDCWKAIHADSIIAENIRDHWKHLESMAEK